jgi:hypothetical protein
MKGGLQSANAKSTMIHEDRRIDLVTPSRMELSAVAMEWT